MDMKLVHDIRKKHLLILGAFIIMVSACSLLLVHFFADRVDIQLKAHDIAQTDREMTAARNTLIPLLNSLNIKLSEQNAASCTSGDPQLYAHSCGTQAVATYTGDLNAQQDAETISRKLQTVDTSLKSNGWEYNGNDFRSRGDQPVSTWTDALRTYGADIAYQKGTCYFTIIITVSVAQDKYRVAYPGGLYCYIASGPPTSL